MFDDYDPAKPTSQAQDAANQVANMAWVAKSQDVLVGSETGGAVANASIAFAHGMQTASVGWSDAEMRRVAHSPYYLGAWFPAHQPALFFKTSAIEAECKHPAAPSMNAPNASPYSDFRYGDRNEFRCTQGVVERAGAAMA